MFKKSKALKSWSVTLMVGLFLVLVTYVSANPIDKSLLPWQLCNSFMVGKTATVDGSVIISQTAGTTRARYVPAADHKPDAKRVVKLYNEYDKLMIDKSPPVRAGLTLEIPEVAHTYAYVEGDWWPFMNEHQLAIAETTLGKCRKELTPSENSDAKLRLTDVTRLAAERARTAREAIEIMGSAMEQYGFNPWRPAVGEFLSVADKNEVWAWEVVPVGPNWKKNSGEPGAAWVAMRIPDDMFAPSCNESIIGEIDLNDKDLFMASSNVKSLATKNGWWDPNSGEPFRWDVAYWGKRANSLRTWRSLSLVAPSLNLKPGADGYPIPIKPDKKLSILDIRKLYGDFYEGTEFDKTKGVAAGPFGNPWWPPGTPDLETSIPDATGESVIITQSRNWLPDPIGGVMWVGMGGSGDATVYVPFYAGITKVPKAYTIGVKTRFDWDSAFWTINLVGNFARLNYAYMMKEIKVAQHALETMQLNRLEGIDEEAYSLYRQNPASATRFLNDYCEKNANEVLARWRDLTAYLIARWAPSTFPNHLHEPLALQSWRDALSQK